MRTVVLLAVLLVVLAGCSVVMPSDQSIITEHYGNAVAINAKVQADPALPAYAKTWWAAEERTWYAMDQWAKGKKASPGGAP